MSLCGLLAAKPVTVQVADLKSYGFVEQRLIKRGHVPPTRNDYLDELATLGAANASTLFATLHRTWRHDEPDAIIVVADDSAEGDDPYGEDSGRGPWTSLGLGRHCCGSGPRVG